MSTPWYASPIWQTFQWTPQATALHSGVDLGMPIGTPITAPMDGTIVSVGHMPWGGQVNEQVIVNGQPFVLTWIHLSTIDRLEPGQTVRAGQILGHSGTPPAGWGTGAHTHFEATAGTVPAFMGYNPIHPTASSHPVNPMPFLALAAGLAGAAGAVSGSAPPPAPAGSTGVLSVGGVGAGCMHSISIVPGQAICLDPTIDGLARATLLALALVLLLMAGAIFVRRDSSSQAALQTAGDVGASSAAHAARLAALAI